MGYAFHRDLTLFHGLQQRTLRLGRGTVDLVGQQHLREDRAGHERKALLLALIDAGAGDVGRQQVVGELDALVVEPQRAGQRVGQRGLAHAGQVFQQQVATGEQAGQRQADLARLADDDGADLHGDFLDLLQHGKPA